MVRGGRVETPDGGSIAYAVHGAGPPLLLLSGLGGMGAFWHAIVPGLSSRFTVILHDHRGTGSSSRCDRPYSIASMAADTVALMDQLQVQQAAVVGHSTGGAIAQHLALHVPQRLGRLVLSATWARPCSYMRRLFALRLRILNGLGKDAYLEHGALIQTPPATAGASVAAAPPTSPLEIEIIRRRIGALLAHDVQDMLPGIALPVLAVTAADDMVVPAYHSTVLAQAIPGARLTIHPDGGHFVPHVHPDAYATTISAFLSAGAGR